MQISEDPHRYDAIIQLPHHRSLTHPHMSLYDRAAQFAPFAALSGYDEMISEEARITEDNFLLFDDEAFAIEQNLNLLKNLTEAGGHPEVTITYFVPDNKKAGGSHTAFTGKVKSIDSIHRKILFYDPLGNNTVTKGTEIAFDTIIEIQMLS